MFRERLSTLATHDPHAQWVFALSIGRTWVRDSRTGQPRFLDVTPERALALAQATKSIMASFEASAALTESEPVRLPVLALHAPQLGEFGHLYDVRVTLDGPKAGIWLKVGWNNRHEPGRWSHVSVGIDPEFTTQDGKKHGTCIVELSLCSTPKDQRLGSLSEAVTARLAHTLLSKDDDMDPEELIAAFREALTEALAPALDDALKPIFELLEAAGEETPDDEDGDGDDAGDAEDDAEDEGEDGEDVSLANVLRSITDELGELRSGQAKLAAQLLGRERGRGGRTPKKPKVDPKVRGAKRVLAQLKAKEKR